MSNHYVAKPWQGSDRRDKKLREEGISSFDVEVLFLDGKELKTWEGIMDLNPVTLSGALSRFSHFTCTCFNKVKN